MLCANHGWQRGWVCDGVSAFAAPRIKTSMHLLSILIAIHGPVMVRPSPWPNFRCRFVNNLPAAKQTSGKSPRLSTRQCASQVVFSHKTYTKGIRFCQSLAERPEQNRRAARDPQLQSKFPVGGTKHRCGLPHLSQIIWCRNCQTVVVLAVAVDLQIAAESMFAFTYRPKTY